MRADDNEKIVIIDETEEGKAKQRKKREEKPKLPVDERLLLSVTEAAAYVGIPISKMRLLVQVPHNDFVIFVGRRCMIKRMELEKFIEKNRVI